MIKEGYIQYLQRRCRLPDGLIFQPISGQSDLTGVQTVLLNVDGQLGDVIIHGDTDVIVIPKIFDTDRVFAGTCLT